MSATSAALQSSAGKLRPMRREDNPAMAAIIRTVMTEFGCTAQGFAIHDPEVDCMFETYQLPRSAYFVIDDGAVIGGGGGLAPLRDGDADTCELQKFYFLKEYRGFGYGKQLLAETLRVAREQGFRRVYVETMEHMDQASAMYVNAGFRKINGPMGATGHFRCNRWYAMDLV